MFSQQFLQLIGVVLGILLIAKLVRLHLHKVYTVFCLFLACDLLASIIYLILKTFLTPSWRGVDYRIIWLLERPATWFFTLWAVLTLLEAILSRYQGILAISKVVFRYTCWIAAAIGIASAVPEYLRAGYGKHSALIRLYGVGIVGERVVASVALLALVGMLIFLVWFPVRIPKNLAFFTIGFVAYFLIKNCVYLIRSVMGPEMAHFASTAASVIACLCFAYWYLVISSRGESTVSNVNIHWRAEDEKVLMSRLELLNDSLLKTAKRP